jgi:uncharacterized membrane protein HdeD (DUF308 family)
MLDVAHEREHAWWAVLVGGLVTLLLGVFLLASPAKTIVAIVALLGVYWLVRGIVTIIGIFAGSHAYWGWRLVAGIISILAGIFVLAYPLASAAIVPFVYVIILGIQALVVGAMYIYSGATGGGGGEIALGIFDVVIGLWILASPYVAALALPFALGILAIIGGIALIVVSFSVRSHQHAPHGMAPA